MGAFIGGILNYGLSKITDDNSFSKVITTIFGAAFSGVIFVFLEILVKDKNGDFSYIYMYPVGLIMALLWAQIPPTIEQRIKAPGFSARAIGWAHIVVLSLFTVFFVWKLFTGDTK